MINVTRTAASTATAVVACDAVMTEALTMTP